jgi:hypothetical protein
VSGSKSQVTSFGSLRGPPDRASEFDLTALVVVPRLRGKSDLRRFCAVEGVVYPITVGIKEQQLGIGRRKEVGANLIGEECRNVTGQ